MRGIFEAVPTLLESLGFVVKAHFGDDALDSTVFTSGVALRDSTGSLQLAGFAAHGSEKGLHAADGMLLELQQCTIFDRAILILCSCMGNGEFPSAVTQLMQKNGGQRAVQAVICYEPKLKVFPKGCKNKRLKSLQIDVLRDCIHEHFRLIGAGKTVGEAIAAVQRQWQLSVQKLPHGDMHFGMTWLANADRVKCWGRPSSSI